MNTSASQFAIGDRPVPDTVARPFVKWVGGKRRVVPDLLPLMPEDFGTYHEPFAGGGAVFFALVAAGGAARMRRVFIGDLNERLVRSYCGIRDDVEDVIARLDVYRSHHDKDHYYRVRTVNIDVESNNAAVAAWMIYLNKTGFNGLYRVNRKGGFNVPLGSYTNPRILDEPNLRACSRVLSLASVICESFEASLDRVEPGDVVYFDPPYVPLSSTANFTSYTKSGFGPKEQVRLRDLALTMKQRGVRVFLSNHDTQEVRDLYGGEFEWKEIEVGRAINSNGSKRGRVGELIIW